ncbi:MAG TPA: phosphopantetheine-binding protein, partial [Pyrinomonadaceae bacterium]
YLGRSDHQVKVRGYRIELGEIETALREHPAVRESVVMVQGESNDSRILAYVVLDDDARPSDDGEQTRHLRRWQSIWDETYRHDTTPPDPRFNIIGWNSSYTGEPIPENEMRDWVNGVTERILALNPRTVLEIGSGTGLILFRVAPQCSLYYATDTSNQALRYVQAQFGPGEFENVVLTQGSADDLSALGSQKFDLIVLNSVVQYFPNVEYLVRVLRRAVELASPDGAIFLGDIRSLSLLRLLHTELQISHAPLDMTIGDLQQTIDTKIALEKELVIDSAFFHALRKALPGIGRVEIQLKRGRNENELTKFRYDVILHLGDHQPTKADSLTYWWGKDLSSIEELRQILRTSEPESLILKDVPNSRLISSVRAMESLAVQPPGSTVGDLRKDSDSWTGKAGIDPEDMWALALELPYVVEVTWAESGSGESFDVVLIRNGVPIGSITREISGEREPNWKTFANDPLHSEPARDLLPSMRGFLAERLPQHMIPSMIMELRELPLTANGKIDREALGRLSASQSRLAPTPFVPPGTAVEASLANIWAEVLRIERVGIRDNFFELGGHSLLATQVVSRIRERLGVNLQLRSLFESPTVAELAQELMKLGLQSHATSELPITKSIFGMRPLLSQEIDRLSEDQIDSLLYQVLEDSDRKI